MVITVDPEKLVSLNRERFLLHLFKNWCISEACLGEEVFADNACKKCVGAEIPAESGTQFSGCKVS